MKVDGERRCHGAEAARPDRVERQPRHAREVPRRLVEAGGVVTHVHVPVDVALRRHDDAAVQVEPGFQDASFASYSTLMPADLMIGHHFSTSPLWNAARPSGVCCSREATSSPRSAKRACTFGSARPCIIAAFSFATISFGVARGANRPNQPDAYRPGIPLSSEVGMSGMTRERAGERLARILTAPARACGSVTAACTTIKSTWPPSMACIAGPAPR